MSASLHDARTALVTANEFLHPILSGRVSEGKWDPATLSWTATDGKSPRGATGTPFAISSNPPLDPPHNTATRPRVVYLHPRTTPTTASFSDEIETTRDDPAADVHRDHLRPASTSATCVTAEVDRYVENQCLSSSIRLPLPPPGEEANYTSPTPAADAH